MRKKDIKILSKDKEKFENCEYLFWVRSGFFSFNFCILFDILMFTYSKVQLKSVASHSKLGQLRERTRFPVSLQKLGYRAMMS